MADRGLKCPHVSSISDFDQNDVQRAKEVRIRTLFQGITDMK
jgi:hypothetical protein